PPTRPTDRTPGAAILGIDAPAAGETSLARTAGGHRDRVDHVRPAGGLAVAPAEGAPRVQRRRYERAREAGLIARRLDAARHGDRPDPPAVPARPRDRYLRHLPRGPGLRG